MSIKDRHLRIRLDSWAHSPLTEELKVPEPQIQKKFNVNVSQYSHKVRGQTSQSPTS